MKIKTQNLNFLKSMEPVKLECEYCNSEFALPKNQVMAIIKGIKENTTKQYKGRFCSRRCKDLFSVVKKKLKCSYCNKTIYMIPYEIKKSKSGNHFCSLSCSTLFNNLNKSKGNRISKNEQWIKEQLGTLYPHLNILYNDKRTIKSELDILIPSLNIAFEINGIYHYKPIHGKEKLKNIKNNDAKKTELCNRNNIKLIVINTSEQKKFDPMTSQKYLDIIKDNIIKCG